jgi:Mrp family chromosome partitioning ATPase
LDPAKAASVRLQWLSIWLSLWANLVYRVGLMDADVYGPNVPLMMGINQTPMAMGERIQPLQQFWRQADVDGFSQPRRQAAGVARTYAA